MVILALLTLGAVMAALAAVLAIKIRRSPLWGLFAPVLATGLFWTFGSIWLHSSLCPDVQTCDGGGWMVMTIDAAVIASIASAGGVVGVLVSKIVLKLVHQ